VSESRGVGAPSEGIVAGGRVSWFNPAKKFGFVKLDDHLGDAFLHFNVLKEGGYYFLPRGTTVRVRAEPDERGAPSVVEVLHVDTSTAREGEPPPLLRKKRAERREQQEREVEESQTGLRASITETDRLVGESHKMLKRHGQEREADDAEEDGPSD
jgi:cold shock CspA family protein